MSPSDTDTITSADDVLTTEFDSEVVILNLRDGVYYGLDQVGARVWGLLRTPSTVTALRDVIASEYDVEPGRCADDVRALIDELAARNLITIRTT